MRNLRPSVRPLSPVLLLICLAVAACQDGPRKYRVTGKVTRGGKPLEVNWNNGLGRVRVLLQPMDGGAAEPCEAVVKPDGTFVVEGLDGRGVAPGKYRVCVYQYDPFPQNDRLKGAFALGRSPIQREVTGDNHQFEIDLDKPS